MITHLTTTGLTNEFLHTAVVKISDPGNAVAFNTPHGGEKTTR
jgi:hypothetical protein